MSTEHMRPPAWRIKKRHLPRGYQTRGAAPPAPKPAKVKAAPTKDIAASEIADRIVWLAERLRARDTHVDAVAANLEYLAQSIYPRGRA